MKNLKKALYVYCQLHLRFVYFFPQLYVAFIIIKKRIREKNRKSRVLLHKQIIVLQKQTLIIQHLKRQFEILKKKIDHNEMTKHLRFENK